MERPRIPRSAITDYLTRSGWTLIREASSSVIGQADWWDAPTGQRISLPSYQGWTDDDARTAARKIGQIAGVPPHQVMGTPAPFDPKSDPVLHFNGRGRAHHVAFAEADDARQERHMKREHSADPKRALIIAGAATLTEAHHYFHDRLERH